MSVAGAAGEADVDAYRDSCMPVQMHAAGMNTRSCGGGASGIVYFLQSV